MKLEAKGIARTYFRGNGSSNFFYAVEKTDFVLEEGKLTEIVGRSGSGKSTLANMLCGLLTPSEGIVLLDGKDLYALTDNERSILRNTAIGVLPQGQSGLASLTVLENVLVPAGMYGKMTGAKERAMELLGITGIADLADVYANELSGGELRRMALARALINEPAVLMADEPTSDLDDESTGFVLRLLKEKAKAGMSVLMVTHDREALPYADKVFRMDQGKLKEITNTAEEV